MADETMPAASGQLMTLSTVAAANIAKALGTPEHQHTIEGAIKDEISALSSHFILSFADLQEQYHVECTKLKHDYDVALDGVRSAWSYVKANKVTVGAALSVAFLTGFALGRLSG